MVKDNTKQQSFYEKRMADLLVTDENNFVLAENPHAEYPVPAFFKIPFFEEDSDGNIVINFFHINKERVTYIKMGDGKMSHVNGKPQVYQQKRLKDAIGDYKYQLPKGEGVFPFISPLLMQLYENKEKVTTLYLTEGAFKGWLACQYGIPCFGLTSITHFRDSKTKKIHDSILLFIGACEVENVVVLWDGDCLNISEKDLFNRVEVTKRPFGFFNSANNIKKLIEELNAERDPDKKIQTWHWHIKSKEIDESPKGLDDLLIIAKESDDLKAVVKSLRKVDDKACPFFKKHNITYTNATLKEYYKLHDAESFYLSHADIIKKNEFIFQKDMFVWKEKDGDGFLKLVVPGWAQNIKWVGDEFYILTEVPSVHGVAELKLIRRKQETISKITGKRAFWTYLEHYTDFVNIPDHWNYQQEINGFYNRYFPLPHVPKKGTFPATINFLKHIFGSEKTTHKEKEFEHWELGVDYVQVLLNKPKQQLPVLILYSQENVTGKSTFGLWLREIFGHNVTKVSNKDFKGQFNQHFASSLIVWCEETLLERKDQAEGIKDMSTALRVMVNPKGQAQYEIDFFAKFIFMSNNKRMIYLNKHDERYWIVKVPVIANKDPFFFEKLKAEIPAFLHHLKNRTMVSQQESRMWFNSSLYRNKAFFETVQINEPSAARELRHKLQDYFLDFDVNELLIPMKDLITHFMDGKIDRVWLKELLADNLNVGLLFDEKTKKSVQTRGYFWTWDVSHAGDAPTPYKKKINFNGRPYVFKKENFVSSEDETVVIEHLDQENREGLHRDTDPAPEESQTVIQHRTNL